MFTRSTVVNGNCLDGIRLRPKMLAQTGAGKVLFWDEFQKWCSDSSRESWWAVLMLVFNRFLLDRAMLMVQRLLSLGIEHKCFVK